MKLLVIFNPIAGSNWQRLPFDRVREVLEKNSISFESRLTEASGDATRFAREAARHGFTHVLAFGGDGTFREVAEGLAGSGIIFVPFPSGTANLLAHELGLPFDLEKIPLLLKSGQVRSIDVGRAEGPLLKNSASHYFLLMAGIGMDAAAIRDVNPEWKKWAGWILYLLSGFRQALTHKPYKAIFYIEGERQPRKVKPWVMVAGNARAYGLAGIRVAPHARIDDGMLDFCVFESRHLFRFILHFMKVLVGRHLEDRNILYFKTSSVRIETLRPVPVHLDGDLFGETPLTLSVMPKGLKILLPTGTNETTH